MIPVAPLEQALRARGCRLTPQRRAILRFLTSALHHPTAEEVYQAVNRQFPMTSRATAYSTLRLLREAGLIRELEVDGTARYDANPVEHHHLICRACGKIVDLQATVLRRPLQRAVPEGWKLDGVEVIARGLCEGCQRARATLVQPRGSRRRPGTTGSKSVHRRLKR